MNWNHYEGETVMSNQLCSIHAVKSQMMMMTKQVEMCKKQYKGSQKQKKTRTKTTYLSQQNSAVGGKW